jgi:hypothetical protein
VDPRALTVTFNERINNRDLDGLAALMTDDHTFIDTAGHAIHGKSACLDAWRRFFAAFPDYRNVFDSIAVEEHPCRRCRPFDLFGCASERPRLVGGEGER